MKQKTIFMTLAMLLAVAATPAQASGIAYAYDALGRLVKMTYDNGTIVTYTYDAAGNRIANTVTCSSTGC